MKILIGITGASGAIYAVKLLENLDDEIHLIISENGEKILEYETEYNIDYLKKLCEYTYNNDDLSARPSSGSCKFDAMVIIPASFSTIGKIASGIGDTLITRASMVFMKEKRKLIVVPRETPLSTIHLKNLLTLSQNNIHIIPAMPAFYHKPKDIDELTDYIIKKVMDALEIENDIVPEWQP